MRHVHSDRVQRWLGDEAYKISDAMRDWYGPPVLVSRVPGEVYATKGGEFVGRIDGGGFMSLLERDYDHAKRLAK